jgi:hypothetical protein
LFFDIRTLKVRIYTRVEILSVNLESMSVVKTLNTRQQRCMRQNLAVLTLIPFKHFTLMFILGNIKLILNYQNCMSHYTAPRASDTCYNCGVPLGKTELSQPLFKKEIWIVKVTDFKASVDNRFTSPGTVFCVRWYNGV